MPYIFPKRRLEDQDVLDPVEMNEDFIPAADLYSGNLDEHNFKSGLNPDIGINVSPEGGDTPILSNSHWNIYYTYQNTDPRWGTPDSYTQPVIEGNTSSPIQNSPAWQPVDRMKLTVVTGNSTLWIVAALQYIWEGFNPSGGHSFSAPNNVAGTAGGSDRWGDYPAMVQFALRVDGQVIDATITGFSVPHEKIVQPYRTTQERNGQDGYTLPGPGQDGESNCGALSAECMAIRLGFMVPVASGTHVVEVVAKRIEVFDRTASNDHMMYSAGNQIGVFNRQLLVVDLPTLPPAVATAAGTAVGAYEAEDTLTAESIGPRRVNVIRDRFNDVQDGALSRGALNNEQLGSQVLRRTQVELTQNAPIIPADPLATPPIFPEKIDEVVADFATWYPGYGEQTFTSVRSGALGWYGPLEERDPGGDKLELTLNQEFSDEAVVLILANVGLHQIDYDYGRAIVNPGTGDVDNGYQPHVSSFAAFTLSRTVRPVPADPPRREYSKVAEAVFNRDSAAAITMGQAAGFSVGDPRSLEPVAHDVPLMQVLKIYDAVSGTDKDSLGYDMPENAAYPTGYTLDTIEVRGASMQQFVSNARVTSTPGFYDDLPATGPASGYTVNVKYLNGNLMAIIFDKK